MVRGRGGQQTRGARGGQMGTRGGRITKNVGNPDFGFSPQTKNTFGGPPRTGGYNKNNSNNNYGGGQQQQPQQNNSYNNNQNQNKPRYGGNNPNQNSNQNNRYSGNNPNNNRQGNNNNPSYNNNQNRGQNNYGQNKGQGQNQNYNNSAQNRNNNPGYNKNQGYNKPNQNYNSGSQFNDNGNNSAYPQRNQNSNQQGYSNNNPAFDNNFGQQSRGGNNYNAPKPGLLGSAPSAPAPPRNEPSSDDILKEIGKVFLTSMTGAGNPQQGVNPMAMMNMMQGGPGGPPPNNNPSRYDNFYNDGNQFTNYNPPVFNNYRGGYGPRGGRGGMMNQRGGGMRPNNNNMRGGKFNNQTTTRSPGQNRRVQGPAAATPGVRKPIFKSKNNPNFVKGKGGNLSPTSKTIKYTIMQLHKSVEENNHPLVAFLRQVFYDLSTSTNTKSHFMMLSRILLKHENAMKLLSYEVKKALDNKFGEGTEEEVLKKKQDFLKEKKTKIFNDYKTTFKGQENMDVKEKAIEEVFPILTGESFTDENVPKPEDYVANLETTEEDYVNAFKMAFVKSCFEKFLYRMNNAAMPSKSVGKRVQFYLDNGFLSHLLVDKVKLKTNAKLPTILTKYNKLISNPVNTQKIDNMTKTNYENMKKTNEHLQTDISDYIGGEKVSAEVLRDFADCIILFDKNATALKFKLLNYTPYINLSAEQKKSLFDELVHSVYSTAMNLLKNNIKTSDKKFEDMEKDEVKEGEEKMEVAVDDDEEEEEAV